MKMKPSPFDFQPPSFAKMAVMGLCLLLELSMGIMLMSVYSESIGLMTDSYLGDLPLIGSVFMAVDPDATTNDLISLLLAVFSLGTPLFLWSAILNQKILDDPQDWLSYQNNRVVAILAGCVVALVIALECVSLYTLISRDAAAMHEIILAPPPQTSGLMAFLSENKGMGVGGSAGDVLREFCTGVPHRAHRPQLQTSGGMKMNNILKLIIPCLFLVACSDPAQDTRAPAQKPETIFVIIENGGTVADSDQAHATNTALHLLQHITALSRHKATRNAQVHLILTATPNRLAWSGTPTQLLEQAPHIKELMSFKQSFSDLVMAFEQVETTVTLSGVDKVRLYIIGPFIHVPFQNSDAPIDIHLPQAVPPTLALPNILDHIHVLKFMNVHDDQDMELLNYLRSIGVMARAQQGALEFSLKGTAQTKAALNDLL